MKSALILLAILGSVQSSIATTTTTCYADNCARAVTGTRFPSSIQSEHKADCSSFMQTTVTPVPTTVTVTVTTGAPAKRDNQARQVTVVPTGVPTYASACSGTVRYSSACSCAGITGVTITVPTPVVTVTSTVPATCPAGTLSCNGGACQDVLSDANNCGACGNVCASGVCQNGVCSAATCNGSQCASLNVCGQNCFCFETSSGDGFCGPGTSCEPLPDCNSSSDCPQGTVCATGTCCGRNVCLGPQGCENGVGISMRSVFGRMAERGVLLTNGQA